MYNNLILFWFPGQVFPSGSKNTPNYPKKLDFEDVEWTQIDPDVTQVMDQLKTEVDLHSNPKFEKEVEFTTSSPKVENPGISEFALWLNGNEENE